MSQPTHGRKGIAPDWHGDVADFARQRTAAKNNFEKRNAMNRKEAKFILQSYRSGGQDAGEPCVGF